MDKLIYKYFLSRYPSLKNKDIKKINLLEYIDSASIFDLILYLEKNFKIKIKDDEILFKNFSSIAKIQQFIKKKNISK